jgi:hypothetical protein
VAQRHPAPDEDEITFLFSGELRNSVTEASETGSVEEAFLKDLRQSIPASALDMRQWTRGLVARVNRHSRWNEGKVSGADLGVVIMRPLVQLGFRGNSIEFRRDHATGLLAQAKLGRPGRSGHAWDGLTRPQEDLYPKRREYYSLLLYRLNGQTQMSSAHSAGNFAESILLGRFRNGCGWVPFRKRYLLRRYSESCLPDR